MHVDSCLSHSPQGKRVTLLSLLSRPSWQVVGGDPGEMLPRGREGHCCPRNLPSPPWLGCWCERVAGLKLGGHSGSYSCCGQSLDLQTEGPRLPGSLDVPLQVSWSISPISMATALKRGGYHLAIHVSLEPIIRGAASCGPAGLRCSMTLAAGHQRVPGALSPPADGPRVT